PGCTTRVMWSWAPLSEPERRPWWRPHATAHTNRLGGTASSPAVYSDALPRPGGNPLLSDLAGPRRADGEVPGCRDEMRTRSAPGRMANRSGTLKSTASPSIPAGTGAGAETSKAGAVQARPEGGLLSGVSRTRMPRKPLSSDGRLPRPGRSPSTSAYGLFDTSTTAS